MLSPGRYLLGVAELTLLAGFAWLGAARLRSRLVPAFAGAPAHLASAVLALALLIWVAELLGTVSLFEPVPYLLVVAALGLGLRVRIRETPTTSPAENVVGVSRIVAAIALAIALIAVVHFAGGVKTRLSTGMTGFDSTWYHGPFAAGFFQSGNTIDLHFIAPQFLAWFYPANGEIFHAIGMLAFGRDVLSPLLNLAWFLGCLGAAWCIGRPYRVAPWSLGLAAIALSVPALADQAAEARNDIVGIFFLLAAVALALNGWAVRGRGNARAVGGATEARPAGGKVADEEHVGLSTGSLALAGLAAGLAAGTKLNLLLPAAALVLGLAAIAPRGRRGGTLLAGGLAALAGGGYWFLRNLIHTGNPLPWVHHLGPISLPAPAQGLGGREAHSVLGYLTDGSVWSDWFLPGLHHGLWIFWPALLAAALLGLALCLLAPLRRWASNVPMWTEFGPTTSRSAPDRVLAVAGAAGLAAALAWLVSPTSASGPDGMPRGFESGLRYLAPALVLGLALLPAAPALRGRFARLSNARLLGRPLREVPPEARQSFRTDTAPKDCRCGGGGLRGRVSRHGGGVAALAVTLAVLLGYPIQRHYLENRYANPTFTAPGLDAAFRWARDLSGARIATTSTRQYPLFGADLSNRVAFVGIERPHGGFEAPSTCRTWRQALNAGHYDYVVTSFDRIEPGNPTYPPQTHWTEGPGATVVLKKPPTVVFKLTGPLDPSSCRS